MKLSPSYTFESAPTVGVQMSSLNGQTPVETLPDSKADVCVGRPTLLKQLNEHQDNLLSSSVTLCAVNNTTMLKVGAYNYTDMFHIYPNVTTTLLSWKAARGLTILLKHYPNPAPTTIYHTLLLPLPTNQHLHSMSNMNFELSLMDKSKPWRVRSFILH